jgi:chromosome partitioning protein
MLLVVGNAKGGSGKTTVSVAVAGESAARGRRTLVVDLDVQGNSTQHLIGSGDALNPEGDGGKAFYRTVMDGDPISPVVVSEYLHVLPGGSRTQALADEMQRMSATTNEALGRSMGGLRTALQELMADYDLVVFDTPPSEQSHALLDCILVAAHAVIIPTKISKADVDGAYKMLQRLAALDRLDTPYAVPLGAVLVSVPSSATRLVAHAEGDLEMITRHIPLFNARLTHRPGPITEAERRHLTLRELETSLPTTAERLKRLRQQSGVTEHLSRDSVSKSVGEVAALLDEIDARYTEAAA